MKVHRLVLMIIDFEDLGTDQVRDVLENARYPNRCIAPAVMEMQTADIGEWSDDHPLNNSTTDAAEFARLFPADVSDVEQKSKAEAYNRLIAINAELQSALMGALHCVREEKHPFRHWHLHAAEVLERAQQNKEASHG